MNEINEKGYWRVRLGRGHKYAEECFADNYIGTGWFGDEDLTGKFPEELQDFRKIYVPKYFETVPNPEKIEASHACGNLYRTCKKMQKGDIVLCPASKGDYRFAKINGDYYYVKGAGLPHRRGVEWFDRVVSKDNLTGALRRSLGSQLTAINVTKYAQEIEELISNTSSTTPIPKDITIEDPLAFALEEHLELFLIKNWKRTELSKNWDLLPERTEKGETVSRQFPTDTGYIDILAISKDKKEFLVVELKKGRASDSVVGQILSYMGDILQEIAEEGQEVKGCIIAFEDDLKIRRALEVSPRIDFYLYEIDFRLKKV